MKDRIILLDAGALHLTGKHVAEDIHIISVCEEELREELRRLHALRTAVQAMCDHAGATREKGYLRCARCEKALETDH